MYAKQFPARPQENPIDRVRFVPSQKPVLPQVNDLPYAHDKLILFLYILSALFTPALHGVNFSASAWIRADNIQYFLRQCMTKQVV